MLTLCLDTTGPACDVALVRGSDTLAARNVAMSRGQEAALAGITQDVLAAASLQPADLERIAVVTGPGSFTGTRVGVAFARGLALSLKVEAVGVTSLMAALPPLPPTGLCLMLRPAQVRPPERTWWGQVFSSGAVRSQPFEMDEARLGVMFSRWGGSVLLAGSAGAAGASPPERLARISRFVEPQSGAVRAGQWAQTLSAKAFPPVPAYVRAPDAAPPGGG